MHKIQDAIVNYCRKYKLLRKQQQKQVLAKVVHCFLFAYDVNFNKFHIKLLFKLRTSFSISQVSIGVCETTPDESMIGE